MINRTLDERERAAYIAGQTRAASLLASVIDAKEETTKVEQDYVNLQEENDALQREICLLRQTLC